MRSSQTVIDLADGDPAKGAGFGGIALAVGLAFPGVARWWLGLPGWQQDFQDAKHDGGRQRPDDFALVNGWCYAGIFYRVLRADDVRGARVRRGPAERVSGEVAIPPSPIRGVRVAYGAFCYRDDTSDGSRGLERWLEACAVLRGRIPSLVPMI